MICDPAKILIFVLCVLHFSIGAASARASDLQVESTEIARVLKGRVLTCAPSKPELIPACYEKGYFNFTLSAQPGAINHSLEIQIRGSAFDGESVWQIAAGRPTWLITLGGRAGSTYHSLVLDSTGAEDGYLDGVVIQVDENEFFLNVPVHCQPQ